MRDVHEHVMDALMAALAYRDDPERAVDALRGFLMYYGETRTDLVYGEPDRCGRGGVTLPPGAYFPLDVDGDPLVVGRRYRFDDGRALTVSSISLGRDGEHTTIHYSDGTYGRPQRLLACRAGGEPTASDD